MTLSHVIFDFADTIAHLQPSRVETLREYLSSKFLISIPTKLLAEVYVRVDLLHQYSSVSTTSTGTRKDYYISYNSSLLLNLGLSHLADPLDLYYHFSSISLKWSLKPGVLDLFAFLDSVGVPFSLLSNFDSILCSILDRLSIATRFAEVFISQDLGLEKPDPRFLELLIKRLKGNPHEIIYLGDSYVLDYLPALSAGLTPFLLDEKRLFEHHHFSVPSIESFADRIRSRYRHPGCHFIPT